MKSAVFWYTNIRAQGLIISKGSFSSPLVFQHPWSWTHPQWAQPCQVPALSGQPWAGSLRAKETDSVDPTKKLWQRVDGAGDRGLPMPRGWAAQLGFQPGKAVKLSKPR